MDGALAGQRAVVVGGGSGIGLGSARALAHDGAHRHHRRPHRAEARRRGRRRSPTRDSTSRTSRATRSTAPRCSTRSTPRPTTSVGCTSPWSFPGSARSRRCCSSTTTTSAREVDANVRPVFLFLKYAGPGDGPRRWRVVRRHLVDRGGVLHQVPRVVRRRQGRGRPAGARRRQRARRARRPRQLGAARHDPHPGHRRRCSTTRR